jgi:hypothetical protein
MSKPTPAARLRARELLLESERLEQDLVVLIGQLTEFTDELQAELKAQRDDRNGGDHGPEADGGLVR